MRVVVFGGSGFIGRALAKELVNRGAEVVVADLNPPPPGVGGLYRFADVRDAVAVDEIMRGADAVANMAALPHRVGNENPALDFEVTARGTLNVLEAARKRGAKKVLFASSTMVYGEQPKLPLDESMACLPKVPYAASKLAAEQYCRVYNDLYGLPAVVLRYANVYGPGQAGGFLLPELMGRLARGEPVTVFGDGMQTRDFVYVDDVTAANVLALENWHLKFGLFNVGSGVATRVRDLVYELYQVAGKPHNIIFAPARPWEITRADVSIALARTMLGYSPKVDLAEGLGRTWAAFSLDK